MFLQELSGKIVLIFYRLQSQDLQVSQGRHILWNTEKLVSRQFRKRNTYTYMHTYISTFCVLSF
jgi:hypothetical protein